jgi:hypothetical protein
MNWYDAEEVAMAILGIDEDAAEDADIDNLLIDRFDVNLEQFQKIAEALLPFTVPTRTALMGTLCQGFAKDGCFIVKQEIVTPLPTPAGEQQ